MPPRRRDATPTDADADASDSAADAAPGDAEDTPEDVVAALFDAAQAGDCEGLIEVMVPDTFDTPGDSPEQAIAACEADTEGRAELAELDVVDISLVSESGDEAVVEVTAVVEGETSSKELELQRVDGAWLISSLD